MGYSHYDTPKGPAGYAVEDTCHEPGCEERIDRGMAYRCGDSLVGGATDDDGNCGWWFCGQHLHYLPSNDVTWNVCAADLARWNTAHPECAECGQRGLDCARVPGIVVIDADGQPVGPGPMPDPLPS